MKRASDNAEEFAGWFALVANVQSRLGVALHVAIALALIVAAGVHERPTETTRTWFDDTSDDGSCAYQSDGFRSIGEHSLVTICNV